MGRPKNTTKWIKVSFQLTEETLKDFTEFCDTNCVTRAVLLERIVHNFMDKNKYRNLEF